MAGDNSLVNFFLLLLLECHHGGIDGVLDDETRHARFFLLTDAENSAEGLLFDSGVPPWIDENDTKMHVSWAHMSALWANLLLSHRQIEPQATASKRHEHNVTLDVFAEPLDCCISGVLRHRALVDDMVPLLLQADLSHDADDGHELGIDDDFASRIFAEPLQNLRFARDGLGGWEDVAFHTNPVVLVLSFLASTLGTLTAAGEGLDVRGGRSHTGLRICWVESAGIHGGVLSAALDACSTFSSSTCSLVL